MKKKSIFIFIIAIVLLVIGSGISQQQPEPKLNITRGVIWNNILNLDASHTNSYYADIIEASTNIFPDDKINITYTSNTRNINNGTLNIKTFYAEPKYSDSKGTLINETLSLMNSEFKPYIVNIIEDGENIVKVLDYNSTAVKIDVSLKSKEKKVVPVKVYEKKYVIKEI